MAASPPDVANDLQTLLQNEEGAVLDRLVQSGGEFDLFLVTVLQRGNNGGTSSGVPALDWQHTGNLMCNALTRIELDLCQRIGTETTSDHQDTELEVGLLARLEQVLDLCTHTLREKTCSLEVLHALSQVFDPGASFNKDDTWASDSSYSKPKGSLLAQLINFFGSCDGFELVRQRLRNARDLPIAHLAALLRPFGQCYQQLSSDTVMRYFMPTVDLVCSHLLSCSDRQLFQQDVPPGELPANLAGQRAAYVIVESVMNLLSVVKSEDVDAEVKVQYWQETILTRLKRALEEETSPQASSPTDSSTTTQQGNGNHLSSSPPTWMSPAGNEPRCSNDWSSGSESEPVSHSSRSCQTMPCVVDSIPPETLDLIDRLTHKAETHSKTSDQESSSSNTGSGGSTGGGGTPTENSSTPPLLMPELLAAIDVEQAEDACFPSTSYAADPLSIVDIRTPVEIVPQEVIIKTSNRREITPVGSIDSRTLQGPAVYMGATTMPSAADSSDSSSLVSTVPSVPRSASELGNTCRVCFEGETSSKNRLIRPCRCSGSAASIHRQCLVKWIHISGNRRCEVCNARFSYVPFSERMRGFMDKFRQNRRWRNAAFAVLVGLVVILYLIIFAVFPGGIMNV